MFYMINKIPRAFFKNFSVRPIDCHARIRQHRRIARKPGDASRLVSWPTYPRERKDTAKDHMKQRRNASYPLNSPFA